jgi:SOS response regulatory protein OraA/RecX
MEHCTVDWKDHAKKRVENYLEWNSEYAWTRDELMQWLKDDEFTDSEIDYAIENCNIDWNDAAVKWAEELIEYDIQHYEDCFVTRENLESSLLNNGFTSSEIEYVKKNAKIEWKYEALKCLKLNLDESITKEEATNILNESGFTADEIEYALNECGIN